MTTSLVRVDDDPLSRMVTLELLESTVYLLEALADWVGARERPSTSTSGLAALTAG